VKLRAVEELLRTIVVKPPLARLEARDDRVTGGGAMFRRMLTWRTITAADVTAFGASAKMKPPSAGRRAFDADCSARLGRRVDTIPLGLHGLLSDFRLLGLPLIEVCSAAMTWAPSPAAAVDEDPSRPHVAGVYAITTAALVSRAFIRK
jgi:hypothetical protein